PRLLPSSAGRTTAASFEKEFTEYQLNDSDFSSTDVLEFVFFTRTGLDPSVYQVLPGNPYRSEIPAGAYLPDYSRIAGKVALDAGCGPGRFLRIAARSARLVIGLEIGAHVERAGRYCAALSNVLLVQGSVLAPPFRPESIDVVWSIGV